MKTKVENATDKDKAKADGEKQVSEVKAVSEKVVAAVQNEG